MNKDPKLLNQSFYVTTPEGEYLLVKCVYESCKITMANREEITNLIMLNMLEFDVILGMN